MTLLDSLATHPETWRGGFVAGAVVGVLAGFYAALVLVLYVQEYRRVRRTTRGPLELKIWE